MNSAADFDIDEADGGTLKLKGNLTLARMGDLPNRLESIKHPKRVDLSGVERMDTVGAWLIHRLVRDSDAEVTGAREEESILLEQVGQADRPAKIRPDKTPSFQRVLGQIGAATIVAFSTLFGLIGFFGAILIALAEMIRHPRRFRGHAVVRQFEVVGVEALAIIGLMSFLIGVVIAQQGAIQLKQFGAEIYTINLVGRLTFRELGVLMTAIMVAGRSGSAFAAQIGSMRLAEEVDAMRTIGVSPMEALIIPRVLAGVLMMPLLSYYAAMIGLVGGGLFCWTSLGIPPAAFIQRVHEVVPVTDALQTLIKAPVFGLLIAISGCYQGMQVEGNAEAVGLRTTAAVVQSIFLAIVLDAFFAVFFATIGWI
ncbi:phospholipid/cholesterol/gamma-HCH transport system permease protein [Sphingomonas vulcanisoli]|uniref:Phospholipid/cholesterol/gamma-HCH transport system permease protein n=1 Tax=Sphingomonas vulcanisoli TaxID=1658060 RepID=A0ABX0TUK2_9SPHN|nr:MlaE family lipid ABC transporter permease subunit [Sphingomonas vulcanisoli]NIJ07450.1 phospholipid/cholesterol/gamma-HCH transport system permease protein [Sphingomonas vulcanisoli]